MKSKYFMRGMGFGITVTTILFASAMVFYQPRLSEEEVRKEAEKLGMVDEGSLSSKDAGSNSEEEKAEEIKETVEGKAKAAQKKEEANAKKKEELTEKKEEAEEKKNEANEQARKQQVEAEAVKEEAEAKKSDAEEKKTEAKAERDAAEESIRAQSRTVEEAASSNTKSDGHMTSTENKPALPEGTNATNRTVGQNDETSGEPASSEEPVEFVVKSGENSAIVGANLYKAGLVDNPTQFDRYLEQHNYDNNIQNGSFSIKKGSTYEEIAKILTGK